MDPNINRPTITASQFSIQNEYVTFEKVVYQLSEFKGRNLIKRLNQISEENNFDYITFKSGYKNKEFKILENLLSSVLFKFKEINIDEESNIFTLTIMGENQMYITFASLIMSRLARNATTIIRDNCGERDEGVYRDKEYYPVAPFIGRAINSNSKKTKISDGAIYSYNERLRRNSVPPIIIEVGATQSEFKLLDIADIASTWLNYEERGSNMDAVLLCNVRREVRPEIEDKGAAARRPFIQTRLEYIDFAMYLREHRTVLHTTRQETDRALQLNYCSAATVHVTYPAEDQFHLEFIQPPHSIDL